VSHILFAIIRLAPHVAGTLVVNILQGTARPRCSVYTLAKGLLAWAGARIEDDESWNVGGCGGVISGQSVVVGADFRRCFSSANSSAGATRGGAV